MQHKQKKTHLKLSDGALAIVGPLSTVERGLAFVHVLGKNRALQHTQAREACAQPQRMLSNGRQLARLHMIVFAHVHTLSRHQYTCIHACEWSSRHGDSVVKNAHVKPNTDVGYSTGMSCHRALAEKLWPSSLLLVKIRFRLSSVMPLITDPCTHTYVCMNGHFL